ncbi:basic proline-rich protein-like [Elephas maximus indicus]|uniref:basic proline-rich protein-like n=1 Tax=Elephas maximus indicus TaxID=99487 RepID=UPI0021163F57|nr:basic proline-rich protein-like [Elephas maximus indicus]
MPLLQAKPSGGDSPCGGYSPRHVSSHHNTGTLFLMGQKTLACKQDSRGRSPNPDVLGYGISRAQFPNLRNREPSSSATQPPKFKEPEQRKLLAKAWRAHLPIPRPLIPPSVHLPAAHPPPTSHREGEDMAVSPKDRLGPPQLTWTEGAANSLPPNLHRGLEPQRAEPQPPAGNPTWTHRHTPSETYNRRHTHTHKWTPERAHPVTQTLGWTSNPDPNPMQLAAHTLAGGWGEAPTPGHTTHAHTPAHSPSDGRATAPQTRSRSGSRSGGHTRSAGHTTSDRHPAHTRMATQAGRRTRRRRAHTGPRERTPGPPQRRGHTLTRCTLTPALTPAPPPAASPAAAGRAHPAPGGPGPGPAAAASLRAMVGGGPGEGARCRGAASLPPPALPPQPPPSSALRAARRPSPAATTAARGEGAPTGAGRAGGAAADPRPPAPGSAADSAPLLGRRRPAPDHSPAPPPALPASPETPPDHAPTGMGTPDLPVETLDYVPIPRGTSDPALPALETQTISYSHLAPQTMSYSPW